MIFGFFEFLRRCKINLVFLSKFSRFKNLTNLATVGLAIFAGPIIVYGDTFEGHPISNAKLCLDSYPDGESIKVLLLPKDGLFELSFIHSVSLTPVRDFYQARADKIIQTAEEFETHGQGLPSFADDIDATGWRKVNHKFILDMQRPVDPLIVRVQSEYKNTLSINGQHYRLADFQQKVLSVHLCTDN